MQPLNNDWFLEQVPPKPMGRYAHIITLRVTDSYPLFQTDGELNTARVSAGEINPEIITRLTMFKRKQSTPERLTGRELLRRYGFLSADTAENKNQDTGKDGLPIDDYNEKFYPASPDSIAYGFAIGDSGSEKSKVITDTAYSLTVYADSHEAFTLNAPYEDGTMTRRGEVTSRINEQDHVIPQIIFPGVITTHDLTLNLFLYVLNNIVRTRRYGAQTTRTGSMQNHIVAIALTDGEIFSNLKFTQRLYDALKDKIDAERPNPISPVLALAAAAEITPALLQDDYVQVDQLLVGDELASLLSNLQQTISNEETMKKLLADAFADSEAYHAAWVAKGK